MRFFFPLGRSALAEPVLCAYRKTLPTSSTIRATIFILSLSLSIFVGTTAIQTTVATTADPFYWEKMDVDLRLIESGDLLVTETQKYVFTDKYTNRRNRYIQIDKIDSIQDIAVTENNQPVANLQTSKSDGRQHIFWEHPVITKFPKEHIFVLKYRVIGGLEVDRAQTKFKWVAIFPDRQAAIKAAQVTLHLPAKLAGAAKDFTTNGVAVEIKKIDFTTIQFVTKGSIDPHFKLAILGQFPTNLLTLKKSQWQSSSNFIGWQLFAVYLIIFFIVLTYAERKFYSTHSFIVMIIFLTPVPFFMLPWWTSVSLFISVFIYLPIAGGRWNDGGWGGGGGGGDGGGCGGDGGGCGDGGGGDGGG